MESIHITLDTQRVIKSQNIKVTKGDSAIQFVVKIQRNGEDKALQPGTIYTLSNLRLDGVAVLSPTGVITGENEVAFLLGTTETEVVGTVRASVQMYHADGRVSTISFTYNVMRDLSSDYIPSESEKTLIESVLVEGPVVIGQAKDIVAKMEELIEDGVEGIPGEKGEPGERGLPGENGRDGIDGKDGLPGPAGEDGERGIDGLQGPAGADGEPGPRGADGANGAPGEQGIQGLPGTDGLQGERGPIGEPGPAPDVSLFATKPEVKSAMDRAEEAFTQANDGKTLVAVAVTAKGVSASPADTFSQLAVKIGHIESGGSGGNEGVPIGPTIIEVVDMPIIVVGDTHTITLKDVE